MKKSVKVIIGIVIILLLAVTVFAGFSALNMRKKLVVNTIELETLKEEKVALEQSASTLKSDLEANISVLEANKDELESARTTFTKEKAQLESEVTSLNSTIDTLEADKKKLQNQVNTLDARLMCKDRPASIDYTSNSSVSTSLKNWIDEPSYSKANWETIWSNSKATIHQISGEYTYRFVVYFDDSVGFTNGVFDIGNMCWLDN